jgi:hypothetical protein
MCSREDDGCHLIFTVIPVQRQAWIGYFWPQIVACDLFKKIQICHFDSQIIFVMMRALAG